MVVGRVVVTVVSVGSVAVVVSFSRFVVVGFVVVGFVVLDVPEVGFAVVDAGGDEVAG